jgi:hypothetical protein
MRISPPSQIRRDESLSAKIGTSATAISNNDLLSLFEKHLDTIVAT